MLAETEKIFAESPDYSAVLPPQQQPSNKLLFPGTINDPNLTFFLLNPISTRSSILFPALGFFVMEKYRLLNDFER